MLDLAWVIAGIVGLWAGTEGAVQAGGEIGRRLALSEMFLGLTVFAIGTDVSELLVAVEGAQRLAAGDDTGGLIVGNALGSVLAQGGLALGVLAFFGGLKSNGTPHRRRPLRDAAGWLAATVILLYVVRDGDITQIEGGLLVVAYALYLAILLSASRVVNGNELDPRPLPLLGYLSLLIAGLAVVVVSADVAVEHAMAFAIRHDVNPTVVGLFGIGVGTSLPELAVSIGALARGRLALSLGNILGSNTFDLLVPLGVGALIHPIPVAGDSLAFDLPAVAILAAFVAHRLWRRGALGVLDAVALFAFYVGFLLFRVHEFVV